MDIKPRSNHRRRLAILRAMTPDQRLRKSFELTEYSRQLMLDGIRNRNPNASQEQIHQLFLARLEKCHNRNY
jgi:hypothetical protein